MVTLHQLEESPFCDKIRELSMLDVPTRLRRVNRIGKVPALAGSPPSSLTIIRRSEECSRPSSPARSGNSARRKASAASRTRWSCATSTATDWLAGKEWLVGSGLTLADLAVYAQLRCIDGSEEGRARLSAKPAVRDWMSRVPTQRSSPQEWSPGNTAE
jgi:hypothetical protein